MRAAAMCRNLVVCGKSECPGTAARIWFLTIEHMTIQRMEHVGIVVDDLAAATELRARGAELVGELERYEDSYRLCYVRGPDGYRVELIESG
jgi:hypothetical protein